MLRVVFSNRVETLRDAVLAALDDVPNSPFDAQQLVVPNSAMRRYLTHAVAERRGVCANVQCVYLAQWLWTQIAKVVPSVPTDSVFAATTLRWRIYGLLSDSAWTAAYPRLAGYLTSLGEAPRWEFCAEVATLFEQYITYRQPWTAAWLARTAVDLPRATRAQRDDEAWQAELWRRIIEQLGIAPEHPASLFFRHLRDMRGEDSGPLAIASSVQVFCLPAMPPLYLEVLTGLARWIDITLYVLNPCCEYWFDIVDAKRLHTLALRGAADYRETGNRLLASWGKQTRAAIELLVEGTDDAPFDDTGFVDDHPATLLGALQRSIFTLTELEASSVVPAANDRSVEVHVCHSLIRELEVLQDQLLAVFAAADPPRPQDVLIVTPDLETAAPLIEAVFGNVPLERRLPFAITGRGRSTDNAAARALLSLIAVLSSRFAASDLLDLLQQPLIARRFGIDPAQLGMLEQWFAEAGIRWALDAEHRVELGLPPTERFTIEDGLDRLLLGYALPRQVSEPVLDRLPAGNAEGSRTQSLSALTELTERLKALRADWRNARTPDAWLDALLGALDTFLEPLGDDLDAVAEVRAALRELHTDMQRGGLTTPIALSVIRVALQSAFDDPARGGVPTGAITFSSMTSLRNLPYRFIGVLGLNDGAFPTSARPREFDLMAADRRPGDRQRGVDDRNVFLDLVLAARERLYLSYTGRSIRDDSKLSPSVLLSELLETLIAATARAPADSAALAAARTRLVVEHPLQAFAEVYFRGEDTRLRSFNRELCEALRRRATIAATAELSVPSTAHHAAPVAVVDTTSATPGILDEMPGDTATLDDDAGEASTEFSLDRFFTRPLPAPDPEWRNISLARFLQFFRQPCRFLLRERLQIALFREDGAVYDDEPFTADFMSSRKLAERLMPEAIRGAPPAALLRLAEAGVEYPAGAMGRAAMQEEVCKLRAFAETLRAATVLGRSPLTVSLSFLIEGEAWRLQGTIDDLHGKTVVGHRYDDVRPVDRLTAWLTHLVAAAAAPVACDTRWISRDGGFRLTILAADEARSLLEPLVGLYRHGLRQPIHFFPKSAWAYIDAGRNLARARQTWRGLPFDDSRGERDDAAYRLALRGAGDVLDADFQACAETVFGRYRDFLQEPP